jgi:hypothetical protein
MDEERIAALRREVRSSEDREQVIERFLREGLGQSAGSIVAVFCRRDGELDAEEFADLGEALRHLEACERWRCYGETVNGDNAPEFHDRLSIHPQSAKLCRNMLMAMAADHGTRAEEEVEALSDWDCVKRVESFKRCVNQLTAARKKMARAFKESAAALSKLGDALTVAFGQQLADESELFLAIDHSD